MVIVRHYDDRADNNAACDETQNLKKKRLNPKLFETESETYYVTNFLQGFVRDFLQDQMFFKTIKEGKVLRARV